MDNICAKQFQNSFKGLQDLDLTGNTANRPLTANYESDHE